MSLIYECTTACAHCGRDYTCEKLVTCQGDKPGEVRDTCDGMDCCEYFEPANSAEGYQTPFYRRINDRGVERKVLDHGKELTINGFTVYSLNKVVDNMTPAEEKQFVVWEARSGMTDTIWRLKNPRVSAKIRKLLAEITPVAELQEDKDDE